MIFENFMSHSYKVTKRFKANQGQPAIRGLGKDHVRFCVCCMCCLLFNRHRGFAGQGLKPEVAGSTFDDACNIPLTGCDPAPFTYV